LPAGFACGGSIEEEKKRRRKIRGYVIPFRREKMTFEGGISAHVFIYVIKALFSINVHGHFVFPNA
jgi:hypothetical protein